LADDAGVDPDWIQFFHAYLDNQEGRTDACVDRLESLSAKVTNDDLRLCVFCLMATTQIDAGHDQAYFHYKSLIDTHIQKRSPNSWYEFLFLAMAHGEAHWKPALDYLNKSMELKATPVGLYQRAEHLDFKALDTGDFAALEQALLDNRYAEEFLTSTHPPAHHPIRHM
jgi:hypothetical protein